MTAALSYAGDMAGYMLLALPIWAVLRSIWLLCKKRKTSLGREALLGVFVLYAVGLASQTVLPYPAEWRNLNQILSNAAQRWQNGLGVNLTLMRSIRSFLRYGGKTQLIINLLGNVAIFIPMGVLPPLLWKRWRHFPAVAALSAGTSCLIEFLQIYIGRSVDVDDVLLNVLGGIIGYIVFRLVWKIFGPGEKSSAF